MGLVAIMAPPTPDLSPHGGGEATVLSAGSGLQLLAPPSPPVGEGRGGGAIWTKRAQPLCRATE